MPKTPIANAIVELNHKKETCPLDMILTTLKMEECFYSLQDLPEALGLSHSTVFAFLHEK